MSETVTDTGVLLHGRHLQAIGWERMMWGDPETQRMGSIPTLVLTILDQGPERVAGIVMGTGASELDGKLEAEAARDFFLERFGYLEDYELIANHPRWPDSKDTIRALGESVALDLTSKNTKYEVARAAVLFTDLGVNQVLQVTGRDHGPRCQLWQGIARENGVIPPQQRWKLITDDVPYMGGIVGNTVVLEQPHRGDDETIQWEYNLWPANFMKKFFELPRERRHPVATMMYHIIDQVMAMPDEHFDHLDKISKGQLNIDSTPTL